MVAGSATAGATRAGAWDGHSEHAPAAALRLRRSTDSNGCTNAARDELHCVTLPGHPPADLVVLILLCGQDGGLLCSPQKQLAQQMSFPVLNHQPAPSQVPTVPLPSPPLLSPARGPLGGHVLVPAYQLQALQG